MLVRGIDHRIDVGAGATAPSVTVDNRCDTGSDMRLVAGTRNEGESGRRLVSGMAFAQMAEQGEHVMFDLSIGLGTSTRNARQDDCRIQLPYTVMLQCIIRWRLMRLANQVTRLMLFGSLCAGGVHH